MIEYAILPPLVIATYFPAKYLSSITASYLLKRRNILKNTDVVWDVGCGMSGVKLSG